MDGDKVLVYHKKELEEIKELYESVMSVASHGLFFRSGLIMGERIAKSALSMDDDFGKSLSTILHKEGWAESIKFEDQAISVKGSFEVVHNGQCKTCHMLRGVIARAFEVREGKKVFCTEDSCQSEGAKECRFTITFRDGA